jgi:hypothetical protein
MTKTQINWREKLENPPKDLPKVVDAGKNPKMAKRFGTGKMLIATPLLIDKLIRKVKKGKLVTTRIIREKLAKDFKADFTCPLTTGIFTNIAARAAEEYRAAGRKDITPYWRVVRDDGGLNEKFPGGEKDHAAKLRAEGHRLEKSPRGKKPRVKDLEKVLQKL